MLDILHECRADSNLQYSDWALHPLASAGQAAQAVQPREADRQEEILGGAWQVGNNSFFPLFISSI